MEKLRLVIADDEEMVRSGLRLLIESQDDLEVVAEASDGAQAVEVARRTRPDVMLMDIRMPRLDGIAAVGEIVSGAHAPRVVMLTTFDDDEALYQALRAGASGFLLKVSPPWQLLDAIRAVGSGQALIDPQLTRRVIERFTSEPRAEAPPPEFDELTAREREVLGLLARGLSNREIAEELVVSQATAKTHVARILMKLGLRDRAQAVVYAYEHGVVRPGEQVGAAAETAG